MNQEEISSAIWDASNEIQELTCKLHSLGDLLEILAERVSSDPESGALWLASDTARSLSDKFDDCAHGLMPVMRAVQQLNSIVVVPKKGKK
jgi:hypothetical protein